MNTIQNTNSNANIQNLKAINSSLKEEIKKLKKKSDQFDEVVNERDRLRELSNEFEQWREKHDIEQKRVFNELTTTYEIQTKKLNKIVSAEHALQFKCCELQNINECNNNQLKTLKSNEIKLKSSLKDSENNLKCTEKELACVKLELEKKDCSIKNLKSSLKSNEEELCSMRKKFDECTNKCYQLNEVNKKLEKDLNCTKNKFDELNSAKKCVEEKFKCEREKMCNELKITCKKLNNLELQHDEANRKIANDKCKIKKMATELTELKYLSLKKRNEMKNLIQKINNVNCMLEDELCHLKNKVKQMQREKECNIMELNNQKSIIFEKELQLKKMKILSENNCKIKQNCENICCPVKNIENQPPTSCCKIPMMSSLSPCNKNQACNTKKSCNAFSSKSLDQLLKNLD